MKATHEAHEPDRIASRRVLRIALGSALVFFASLGVAVWRMPHAPERTTSAPPREDGRGQAQQREQRAALDRDIDQAIDRLLANPPAVDAGVDP